VNVQGSCRSEGVVEEFADVELVVRTSARALREELAAQLSCVDVVLLLE